MTDTPTPATNDAMAQRLQALQAARAASTADPNPAATSATTAAVSSPAKTSKSRSAGPAPARIVAAAASVAAGIGLVTLMAGAQQDIVVQVNPTPVTVQPASVVVQMPAAGSASAEQVEVRVVEPAAPAERPAPQAKVVSQSEGS